jgi:hypothetical protein
MAKKKEIGSDNTEPTTFEYEKVDEKGVYKIEILKDVNGLKVGDIKEVSGSVANALGIKGIAKIK